MFNWAGMGKNDTSASKSAGLTRDARGRKIRQLDPVSLQVWHRNAIIDPETLHEIVEALEPGAAKMRRRMITIIPIALLFVVLGVASLYHFSDAGARRDLVSDLTNPVIMVSALTSCLFVLWLVARQARSNRIQFAMLKFRRCPHCGYDLRLLPADPADGATVCPECGCAWLIDDAVLSERLASTAAHTGHTEKQEKILIAIGLLLTLLAFVGAIVALRM